MDDEPLALKIIEGFCSKVGYVELVGKASSVVEAKQILASTDVDVMFLDINMPHVSGIQFAEEGGNLPLIVFTTAYPNYALKGFDLNAVDYLVKPFSFDRFFQAVEKANRIVSARNAASAESIREAPGHLMVKVEYSMVRVDIDDILFVEGLKDYVRLCCAVKKGVVTKSTMKNVEQRLPSPPFVRVHKSFIVNMDKVDSIENNQIAIGPHRIPLGSQYKDEFMKLIGRNML